MLHSLHYMVQHSMLYHWHYAVSLALYAVSLALYAVPLALYAVPTTLCAVPSALLYQRQSVLYHWHSRMYQWHSMLCHRHCVVAAAVFAVPLAHCVMPTTYLTVLSHTTHTIESRHHHTPHYPVPHDHNPQTYCLAPFALYVISPPTK